jgi:hypothetical protein
MNPIVSNSDPRFFVARVVRLRTSSELLLASKSYSPQEFCSL